MLVQKYSLIALLSCTALVTSNGGFASEKIAAKLEATQVSLQEAISVAESAVNGKAYKAKLENDSFGLEYEVDLLVGEGRVEVSVDAVTKEVIRVRNKK